MVLNTGEEGMTLREILKMKNGRDFETIMVRCLWELEGEERDDLIGFCRYVGGKLEALDGDSYGLDDKYVKWEEYDENGHVNLCVWEKGELKAGYRRAESI